MSKLRKIAFLAIVALVSTMALAEPYNRLFRINHPDGDCQIKRPEMKTFEPAVNGKAYPFGTIVKCGENSSAVLLFTEMDAVRLLANSEVAIKIEDESRIVQLNKGLVVTRIGANTTNNLVFVDTPIGRCSSIVGDCKIALTSIPATKKSPALTTVELRAQPVSQLKFVGSQYIIPVIKNGYGAKISETASRNYTEIVDLLGDYSILVNSGLDPDPAGNIEENPFIQPIAMNAKSMLKIWRKKAPEGGRIIASGLATAPSGKGIESFAFAVGRPNIANRTNLLLQDAIEEEKAKEAADGKSTEEASEDAASEESTEDAFGAEISDDASTEGATEEVQKTGDEGLYDFLN